MRDACIYYVYLCICIGLFLQAERKRKEGTIKVTVRNSDLYIRYQEEKDPELIAELQRNNGIVRVAASIGVGVRCCFLRLPLPAPSP